MGEVWLAVQMEPVRRRVALKLIKAGMNTREVVARFESERQALALMDHPTIAKVLDAGSTPQGHPYFVMEYVAGLPITTYCDKHKLATHERLELFIRACEGVQHAHQKAIIHRDLKPSNILVSEVGGQPMPRIIDFGVAKAISQPSTAVFTRAGAVVGTPGYMSPEQADSAGEDIDTRTDVYSLGVVLYELLVGAQPLDLQTLPFDENLRKLREQDAPRPSTKLRSLGPESTTIAQNRGTDPATLMRLLRGDLDAITLKALEKDRSRRYGSPSELAADIVRHLRHESVAARPASGVYRARKYVRRHRIGVAAGAALVLVLVAAAIAQTVELRRVTRERDRADRITNFMTGMFKVSNPSESRGNKVTAREILDKASKDIDTGLRKDPVLQAQMMDIMGGVYNSLGLYSRAESLLEQSVQIRSRVLGANHPDTLRSQDGLALAFYYQGRYADAERLQRQTLEVQRRVLGPEHPDTLGSMSNLALVYGGEARYKDAETLNREALEIRRRTLGTEHLQTVASVENLGISLFRQGRYSEAEDLFRQALTVRLRVLGPNDPDTLGVMDNLGTTLEMEGRYPEAERLIRQALAGEEQVLGAEHPGTLRSMNNLANALMHTGQYMAAEQEFGAVRDIQGRILGPDHPDTAASTYNLACVAAHLGDHSKAISLLRDALDHGLSPDDAVQMENDPDLEPLRSDPRFAEVAAYARQRAKPPTKSQ